MPPRAPSQVHVETLIARGRLVLAVFMLLALRVAMPRGPGLGLQPRVGVSRLRGRPGPDGPDAVRRRPSMAGSHACRRPDRLRGVPVPAGRPGAVHAGVVPVPAGVGHAAMGLARHAHHRLGRRRAARRLRGAGGRDAAARADGARRVHHAGPADGRDDGVCRPGRRVRGLARRAAGAPGGVGRSGSRPPARAARARCWRRPRWCSKRHARCWCGRKPRSRSPSSRCGPTARWSASAKRRARSATSSPNACATAGSSAATSAHGSPVTFLRSGTGLVSWSGMPDRPAVPRAFRDPGAGVLAVARRGVSRVAVLPRQAGVLAAGSHRRRRRRRPDGGTTVAGLPGADDA